MLKEYEVHRDEKLYQSMMNIIIDANEQMFKEGKDMCEAIYRIAREKMQDEFEAKVEEKVEERMEVILREQISKKLSKGKSVEEIADALEENVETIEKIIKEIKG